VRAGDATGIVVITQLKPITVLFTIPQDSLQAVLVRRRTGEKIPVEIYDREQKTRLARGVLLTVDNQIDTTTGTVRLKAQVSNDEGILFPNQFVNVRMLVDTREDAITVPSAAIQRGAQGIFVYVVSEDLTVSMRPVKTGVVEGNRIEIVTGVKAGERVVTDGMDRLRDGMKVELANRERAGKGDGKGKGGGKKGGRRAVEGDAASPAGNADDAKGAGAKPEAAPTEKGEAAKKEALTGDRPKRERAAKSEAPAEGASPEAAKVDIATSDSEPRKKGGKDGKDGKARWGKKEQANE